MYLKVRTRDVNRVADAADAAARGGCRAGTAQRYHRFCRAVRAADSPVCGVFCLKFFRSLSASLLLEKRHKASLKKINCVVTSSQPTHGVHIFLCESSL